MSWGGWDDLAESLLRTPAPEVYWMAPSTYCDLVRCMEILEHGKLPWWKRLFKRCPRMMTLEEHKAANGIDVFLNWASGTHDWLIQEQVDKWKALS